MEEKDFKKLMIPFVIVALAILAFIIVKPLFTPIILGLLLAYIFYPVYQKLSRKIKSPKLSGWIITLIMIVIIVLPLFLMMPLFVKQIFQIYISMKNADLSEMILKIVPQLSSNPSMQAEILASASHFSAKISEFLLSFFQSTILSLPALTFGIIIFLFTFYFSLKEGHKVKDYFTTFFPFPKEFQEKFYDRFGQVTNSVVYGQIIVGLAQGIISGIGYYMFGVPNALILTVITTIVGVIPVIGPWLVWIPLDVFLFLNGDITRGTQLLIYGLFVINWIDTILSPQIVARTAKMNPAIALIGAIGGTYVFGIIGFFIGPLLLAYLILLVELYRNKKPEDSILIKEVPEPKISEDKKQS